LKGVGSVVDSDDKPLPFLTSLKILVDRTFRQEAQTFDHLFDERLQLQITNTTNTRKINIDLNDCLTVSPQTSGRKEKDRIASDLYISYKHLKIAITKPAYHHGQ